MMILPDRIAERLEALGLSERKASIEATGQPDALRFIRTRGTVPSVVRMMKIANVLQTTPEYLSGQTDTNDWPNRQASISMISRVNERAEKDFDGGRSVPIMSTAAFEDKLLEDGQISDDVVVYSFKSDIVGFAAAPSGTQVGRLGAFYPSDTLMSPVFEPSTPVVFMVEQEAGPGEYGLIFFGGSKNKPLSSVFALRRVVDRGEDWITVEQLNPQRMAKIDKNLVTHTRKVLGLRDYVAPPLSAGKTR